MTRRLSSATLAAVLLASGCGGKEFQSHWRDREVVIDGRTPEWYGTVTYLKDEKASIGLMNDDEFLYVSFTSGNPETQMQVLVRGAIVWFDPEGGGERAFGVGFPLGMLETGMARESDPDQEKRPRPAELIAAYRGTGAEVEILHGEEDPIRLRVAEAPRIDVAIDDVQGVLVYELKVPLRDVPHGIGLTGSSTVGIRLKTREMNREELRDRIRAEGPPPSGGRPDAGGRRGGMGGPGMGSRPPELPEPIDLSIRVKLASPESAETPIVPAEGS